MKAVSLSEQILDAEVRGSQWLADGNLASEKGDQRKAEECYRKSQFWLDRRNALEAKSWEEK
jgi:hypothetical protein